MHIALHIDAQLPVLRYGGTERVVWSLASSLVEAGHEVTLLARAGTRADFAQCVALDPETPLIREVPDDVDLVHFHGPAQPVDAPHLVTQHGYVRGPVDHQAVFVSRRHAELHGSHCWVHNGLDWSAYPTPRLGRARHHFHFLGKAAWRVKNLRGAVRATARSGEQLMVMGGRRVNFKMGLRMNLDRHARFLGMVDDHRKARIMEHSRGLVFPVTWHEPFGLAVIESLYFGCPVFATPYGALPELVSPEIGFLSDDEGELADALSAWNRFDPEACHAVAKTRFNAARMAEDYLALYRRVVSGERLNSELPTLHDPVRHLPWRDSRHARSPFHQ